MNRNVLVTIALSLLVGSSIGIGVGYYILQPQIDSLNDDIVLLNEEKNEIESQRIALANVNSDLNFQVVDLNSDLQESELQIQRRLEDIKKLEEDIAVKKDEIDSLGMRISEINDQKAELESDVAMMRNQVQELETNKEENEVEIAELNEEIRENLDRIEIISTISDSLFVERNNLREEVNELKEELEIWELWKEHRDIQPQNNFGYRYQGGVTLLSQEDGIIIPFPNVDNCMTWGMFPGTGSMRPMIGENTIAIAIKGPSYPLFGRAYAECLEPSDIKVGDFIGAMGEIGSRHRSSFPNGVSHQIIEERNCTQTLHPQRDVSNERCYVLKGTHNNVIDGEVRFEEISYKYVIINF